MADFDAVEFLEELRREESRTGRVPDNINIAYPDFWKLMDFLQMCGLSVHTSVSPYGERKLHHMGYTFTPQPVAVDQADGMA